MFVSLLNTFTQGLRTFHSEALDVNLSIFISSCFLHYISECNTPTFYQIYVTTIVTVYFEVYDKL